MSPKPKIIYVPKASLFSSKKAASVSIFMMIAEILAVLIFSYSFIQIAQTYASSETIEKITIADDIKMMIDTFAGIPGDAAAQYPGNVSKYTFILSSSSITVFVSGEGEQKQIVRYFSLPQGYNAFGTVEGKEALCLEKEKQRFLLRECEKAIPSTVSSSAAEGPSFYGIPVTGDNIVLVIDRSSSMLGPSEWAFPGDETGIEEAGDSKLDAAVWQLKKLLAELPDGKHLNLVFFNDEFDTVFQELEELNPETREKASRFADGLEAYGGTNIYAPLNKALSFEGVETIFLLTDGRPYEGVSNPDKFLQKIGEDNVRKVKINTVGVFSITGKEGSDARIDKEIGIKVLKGLAEDSGGTFVQQK